MTSLLSQTKQINTDGGYYINLGDIRTFIYQRTSEPSGNTGLLGGSFSTAVWASSSLSGVAAANAGWLSTTLATAGQAILKDMGRTIVSSNRTFRKIQYVVPATRAASTFGVSGTTLNGESYFTGYIELGLGEGQQALPGAANGPAYVVKFGR
jgi:hypothetical protein